MPNLLQLAQQYISELREKIPFFSSKAVYEIIEDLEKAIETYQATLPQENQETLISLKEHTASNLTPHAALIQAFNIACKKLQTAELTSLAKISQNFVIKADKLIHQENQQINSRHNNTQVPCFILPQEVLWLILGFVLSENDLPSLLLLAKASRQFLWHVKEFSKTLRTWDYSAKPTCSAVELYDSAQEAYVREGIFEDRSFSIYYPTYTDWVIGQKDAYFKAWSLKNNACETIIHPNHLCVAAATPQGDAFLLASSDYSLQTWDLKSDKLRNNGIFSLDHRFFGQKDVLSPNKKVRISINLTNHLQISFLYIEPSPRTIEHIDIYDSQTARSKYIRSLILTLDGKYFISLPQYLVDGIAIWSVAEKKTCKWLLPKTQEKPIEQDVWISASCDSRWVAIVSRNENGSIMCSQWRIDPTISEQRKTFELAIGKLYEISYARDNNFLVGIMFPGRMRIWHAITGQCLNDVRSDPWYSLSHMLLPSTGEIVISSNTFSGQSKLCKYTFPKTAPLKLPASDRTTIAQPQPHKKLPYIFIFSLATSLSSVMFLQDTSLILGTSAAVFVATFLVGIAVNLIINALNKQSISEKIDDVVVEKNESLKNNNNSVIGQYFEPVLAPSPKYEPNNTTPDPQLLIL